MLKVTGLDKLQRELRGIQQAATALDGHLLTLSVDPDNPDPALAQMEAEIDRRIAPYQHIEAARKMAEEYKRAARVNVLQRAAEARAVQQQDETSNSPSEPEGG